MKKKTYFQNDISYYIAMFLMFVLALTPVGLGICSLIKLLTSESDTPDVLKIIVWIIFLIVFLALAAYVVLITIGEMSIIIYMDDKKIWMNDDLKLKRLRLQYKTEAYFSEIKDIRLIKNKKDSRLHSFPKDSVYPGKQKYLVLTMKDDHVERLNVTYFRKGTIEKIISEIIRGINATGNTYEGQYPLWIFNNITSE